MVPCHFNPFNSKINLSNILFCCESVVIVVQETLNLSLAHLQFGFQQFHAGDQVCSSTLI